jgi:hypothetical protein
MTHHDIFNSLTRNAFDFLGRGIAEFDKAPKYSVIHFCSAVEMLLKARLMEEHWSLIVAKPDQANLAKFMAGDFISVTLEDARTRIRDVAGEDIGDDAYKSFRALANHRNKMVHFFHNGLESDEKAKEQIVVEHCRAWFHLHRLLNRWNNYFRNFSSEIARADRAMKGHRKYLAAKFQTLKPELDIARKAGNAPKSCNACGFNAAIPKALDSQITSLRCSVCDHLETQVKLECPRCDSPIVIAHEGLATCKYCEQLIEPENLVDALTDHVAARIAIKGGDASWNAINCGNCEGYHTVVNRGGYYFCAGCFDISSHIDQCGWCGEYNTGDMKHSSLAGCGHCDGKAGWKKDD